MPPPEPAELSVRVVFMSDSLPLDSWSIPPPEAALLLAMDELVRVSVPLLSTPPPVVARLLEMVVWLKVSVPVFSSPPPAVAALREMLSRFAVSVPLL